MPAPLDLLMQMFAVSQGVGNREQQMQQDWKSQQKQTFADMPKTGDPRIDDWSPNVGHPLNAVGGINDVSAGRSFLNKWNTGRYKGILNPLTAEDHIFSIIKEHDFEAKQLGFKGWEDLLKQGGVRFGRDAQELYIHYDPESELGHFNAINVLRNHREGHEVSIERFSKRGIDEGETAYYGSAVPTSTIIRDMRLKVDPANEHLESALNTNSALVTDSQRVNINNLQKNPEVKPLLDKKAAIKKKLSEYRP